nr:uncharacterized protein LOC111512827 [Leptinotarsa decemlineata]
MVWIVVLLMTCSLSSVRLAHIQEKKYVLCLGLISDMITTDITVDERKVKYFVPDNLQYKLPHYIDCLSAAKISVPNNATEQLWYTVQCAYKKDTERFLIF